MLSSDLRLKQLYLNGKKAGKKSILQMISALNDKRIRTEKGGYLFKAGSDEGNLYLGLIPCMIQGERTHHYDIAMPGNIVHVLTGNITPEGILTVLFIPEQEVLNEQTKQAYYSVYLDLASGLLGRGLNGPGELDTVSRMMLEHSGVMIPAPESLLAILNHDRSTPKKS